MAELWSDSADVIIRSVENEMKGKYGIPVSEFLENPLKFAEKEGLYDTAAQMKKEILDSIDVVLNRMTEENRELEENAAACDTATNQILQSITVHSTEEKVPMIVADMVDREGHEEETIYVSRSGPEIDMMVGRLCKRSDFIVDFSTSFNGHKIGEWFFGGSKNYSVKVNIKPNAAYNLYNTKMEISGLFDTDMEMIKGAGK